MKSEKSRPTARTIQLKKKKREIERDSDRYRDENYTRLRILLLYILLCGRH